MTESIEILPINSGNEDTKESNERGNYGSMRKLFRETFFNEKKKENFENEKPHADSSKFNAAIHKSNYEGKQEEIYKLLQPKSGSNDSSLSIIICIIVIHSYNLI